MPVSDRSVLHVLPHPGGGGETYVDILEAMPGYRFTRVYLAHGSQPRQALPTLFSGVPQANLAARRHDLVHVHGEVAGAFCLPALAARPSVVTLHGSHLVRRVHGLRRRAAVANLRALLRAAGRTICIANTEHADLVEAVGPAAAARAVVVRLGLEPPATPTEEERGVVREELGLDPESVVAVWVGCLEQYKDPLTSVLAALETTRAGVPFTLLVAGEGSLRPDLERAAGRAEVVLLGHRRDVRRLLAASDFFVTSSVREGFGFALLEAMAMGLAPVVSRIATHEEVAADTALAAPCGDVTAFAQAFVRLASDREERSRRGRAARERVERHFRAEQMIGGTQAVYESVLARNGG